MFGRSKGDPLDAAQAKAVAKLQKWGVPTDDLVVAALNPGGLEVIAVFPDRLERHSRLMGSQASVVIRRVTAVTMSHAPGGPWQIMVQGPEDTAKIVLPASLKGPGAERVRAAIAAIR